MDSKNHQLHINISFKLNLDKPVSTPQFCSYTHFITREHSEKCYRLFTGYMLFLPAKLQQCPSTDSKQEITPTGFTLSRSTNRLLSALLSVACTLKLR